MPVSAKPESARRAELLERCYAYVLTHGLSSVSLRPLAAAVGSSPRVLLFLFGSKDELVRELLVRARADELALPALGSGDAHLAAAAWQVWEWLAADRHRGLLRLWVESYARSLIEPHGPWGPFARATVHDWLTLLRAAQPAAERDTRPASRSGRWCWRCSAARCSTCWPPGTASARRERSGGRCRPERSSRPWEITCGCRKQSPTGAGGLVVDRDVPGPSGDPAPATRAIAGYAASEKPP